MPSLLRICSETINRLLKERIRAPLRPLERSNFLYSKDTYVKYSLLIYAISLYLYLLVSAFFVRHLFIAVRVVFSMADWYNLNLS